MSLFSNLRTHLPLAGKHARFLYLNLSKNLHHKFVLLRLASQIRQLRHYMFFHSSSQKNIKLSMFQLKINHHILYNRDKLFKAKITDSDSCHVCESKQTLEHLFVECQHVHSFWNLFTSWWNDNNSPSVSLTNNDKIYGYLPENRSFHTFNLCLIVACFYIYTTAKESESYSFLAFKAVPKIKIIYRAFKCP